MLSRQLSSPCVLLSLLLAFAGVAAAQGPAANPADVGTIGDIVRASYETISGPAGMPRQWRRDSTLYAPGATFVAVDEREGRVQVQTMTPEQSPQRLRTRRAGSLRNRDRPAH